MACLRRAPQIACLSTIRTVDGGCGLSTQNRSTQDRNPSGDENRGLLNIFIANIPVHCTELHVCGRSATRPTNTRVRTSILANKCDHLPAEKSKLHFPGKTIQPLVPPGRSAVDLASFVTPLLLT